MKKHLFLKSLLVAIGLLVTSVTTQMWAWDGYFCLGGAPVGQWSKNDTYRISAEGDAGTGYYEAYIETDETFCLYKSDGSQYGPVDENNKSQDIGLGSECGRGYYKSSAWKFTGTNQKVRFCINRKYNSWGDGQYYPSVSLQKAWDPKDDIDAVLAGTKVMFYFGDIWGTGYKRLYTGSGQTGEAWAWLTVREADGVPTDGGTDTWNDFRWAVASVAPAKYYVSNGGFDGIQMPNNAEAGRSYMLYNSSGDKLKVGDNCSYATLNKTSATIEYGTENSGLSVASYPSTSAVGKSNSVYGWYISSDGGSTWSSFNPTDADEVAPGTYKVAPLITDGTIYVKGQEATLTVTEATYTINVSSGDHGRITTGSPSVTAGAYTNPTITAETYGDNEDQYRFEKWVCTGGASVANANSATTTVSATTTGTVTAKFVSVWCLKGGNSASEDGSDALGDWKVNNSLDYTGTSYVYSASIPLAANTTYEFQLWDYPNSTWYRYGGSNSYTLAFIGQTDASLALHSPDESNKMNLRVLTAGEGNYTFTWNSNTKTLTVGYPTVTHPSSDYVYFKDVQNWSSNISAHVFTDSNNPKTGWNRVPLMSLFSFGGETYYYAALGGETSCLFASGTDAPGTTTDDLTEASLNKGKWYNPSTETWNPFTISVTLNNQGATTPGAANVTATYNAAMPSISSSKPAMTGYTFGGYFQSTGGSGTQYYSASGESAHVWDQTEADPVIYAKWTPNPYSLSFNDEGATTTGGNTPRTVTYDASTNLDPVSLPKKEGYNFNGYWTTASGDGAQIFNANGNLIDNVTGYIASSTWTYDGDVELHARWTDDGTYYFSGNNGSSTAWETAANWTKGVVPGSTSNVILLKPVQVPAGTTTTVNSVKIATSGSYTPDGGSAITAAGKLTIPAEAMLVVTTSVQNSAADGSSPSATTAASLHIEAGNTTTDGNGALVWGTSGTPGYATVDFCTKSHGANSEDDINQYIGTPFANNPTMLNQYYNSWMYKIEYTDGVPNWVRINGDATLNEFEGYNLITAYEAGTVYSMEGQLVSNADVTLNGSSTPKLVYNSGVSGEKYKNENVLANSWVAPIKIKNFVDGNFTNVEKSIYIFNAGSPKQAETASEGQAGNYTTYSLGTVGAIDVIPSMQSFSVYTSGATPSLTLDYSELVQKDASNSLIEPNHAPKRYMNDKMDLLKVRVEGDNGWADELKVYIRNDFKSTFEDGWDAHKMYGYPQAPQLYAATADGAMAINCVPTVDNNVVAFQAGSASNEYTMSFAYDGEETIYLNDTKAAVSQEITEDKTYDFTAASGDNVARFTITKSPVYKVPTGMENTEGFTNSASKLMIDGTLYIIRDGRIYNAEGSLVK